MSKKKIFNDPVYGFITIQNDLLFEIIQHRYFQRLRRIKQLGVSEFVYPGALHTRFHHALGACYLMGKTLDHLRSQGCMIFDSEYEAAQIAILLHDVGHGPFSHTLEYSLIEDIQHEAITVLGINRMNKEFQGRLDLALQIFKGKYPRPFLSQLVSSQLDIDRLDYLKRDCYFTGVQEGTIGAERIIKMMQVEKDTLVIQEKGIYSIEHFLAARRIMYWQVYLHKTSISAENILIRIIKRAKYLTQKGNEIMATPAMRMFLERTITLSDLQDDPDLLEIFLSMDDMDIWGSMKFWQYSEDSILNFLSNSLLQRKLFKTKILATPPSQLTLEKVKLKIMDFFSINENETEYLLASGEMKNSGYLPDRSSINIITKDGSILDVAEAADLPNIKAIQTEVKKYYICWPKEISYKWGENE